MNTLSRDTLAQSLALVWSMTDIENNRTILSRDDLSYGRIVIDWTAKAVVYTTYRDLGRIEKRLQLEADADSFTVERLLQAEASAISDMIRPERGHNGLISLFSGIEKLRKADSAPAAVYALIWDFAPRELSYVLIEINDGNTLVTDFESAVADLVSATNANIPVAIQQAKNKIAFLVRTTGLYDRVLKLGSLRDGLGWTWDESATQFAPDIVQEFGEDMEVGVISCSHCCGFRESAVWQLGILGSYVAAMHRASENHHDQHPDCSGMLMF